MFRKLYLPTLMLLFSWSSVHATHIAGGEIYYDCLGGNQYRITLVVYRDCAGVNLDGSYLLDILSPCGNKSVTVRTPGGTEISQLCNAELGNSTCNGGFLAGMQEYVYTGTVSLPPCDSWNISWNQRWRNDAIMNLVNPGDKNEYVEAELNNSVNTCQEAPRFTNNAVPYICMGYPINYSYGVYSPQGDSLVYSFVDAMNTGGVSLPYVNGYTGQEPITGITLDPHSGEVQFTLNQMGNWVVVVRVDRYDHQGNWLGSVMRDMQFIAYPCTNEPPDPTTGLVSGLGGASIQTGPRAIEICESGDFCFDAVISDPNAGDVLTATSNIAQNLPGATMTYSGTNPLTVHICWEGTPGTSGFFPFIITVSDGACPIPAFQTYVYSVHVLPGIQLNAPVITDESCAGANDGSAEVSVSVGMAPFTYQWSTGDDTPQITAGPGDHQVVVTDGQGCASHPLTATIAPGPLPPTVDAGADLVACFAALPIQLTGSVQHAPSGIWSGGNGTFSANGTSATYMPSADEISANEVELVFSSQGVSACPVATDTVHITLPTSFFGSAVSATNATCHGAATGTATFTPDLPELGFLWSPSAQTTPHATGLTAAIHSVVVTDAYGCDTTLTVTIDQPDALTIADLSVVNEQCAGEDNGSITAVVTGGTAPYHYLWSTGGTTDVLHAGAGTYTLEVTDANNCMAPTGTATIQANGIPNVAHAGDDQVACTASLPVQLNASVENASGGTWSGGAGTFSDGGLSPTYMPTAAEIDAHGITLVLTTTGNGSCPPAMDSVHISLPNSFHGAAIATSAATCHGTATGTAAYAPALPGSTYLWDDPMAQTQAMAIGLDAGNYTLLVTDAYGCDTTLSIVIDQPDALLADDITGMPPACTGEGNGSATVQPVGGTPEYTYQWSSNAGSQTTASAYGLPAGSYTVVVTDGNGCQSQASIALQDPQPVTLTAQAPDTVCVNAPVELTAQSSGGTGPHTITWQGIGSGSTVQYSFPTSQVVQVTAVDGAGCFSPTVSLAVTVLDLSQATLHTYGDTVLCPGSTATAGAWLTGYPGSSTITWPTIPAIGNGPFQITTDTDRALPVVVTDACGQTLNDTVLIQVETPPEIVLPPILAQGCAPLTVHFPNGLTTQPVSYFWQLGDGNTSTSMAPVNVYQAGDYEVSLTVTTPLGCSATALNTSAIHAYALPIADFTATPWETDIEHPQFHFLDQSTGPIQNWNWDLGDGTWAVTPDATHSYASPNTWPVTLQVTDANGCTASITHNVMVKPIYDITIPNAFTPNPNGSNNGYYDPTDLNNNVFYPFVKYVKDYRIRIFNRWGELVFESEDILQGWDGHYRGRLSPQDVYVYQMWVRFVDNHEEQRVGDLTLIR